MSPIMKQCGLVRGSKTEIHSEDNMYTSQVIVDAVRTALEKAEK